MTADIRLHTHGQQSPSALILLRQWSSKARPRPRNRHSPRRSQSPTSTHTPTVTHPYTETRESSYVLVTSSGPNQVYVQPQQPPTQILPLRPEPTSVVVLRRPQRAMPTRTDRLTTPGDARRSRRIRLPLREDNANRELRHARRNCVVDHPSLPRSEELPLSVVVADERGKQISSG